MINDNKVLGFCKNNKHIGFLAKKELEAHRCLEKKCPYFKRVENEKAWVEKDKKRRRYKQ